MKCLFLVGIPLSGKSTFANVERFSDDCPMVLCRDDIRSELFGKKYRQNNKDEMKVNAVFTMRLHNAIAWDRNIIVDNTNLRMKYINEIVAQLPVEYEIEYKYFPIGLYKAYWRNVTRYIGTRKWIPMRVIKDMHKRFQGLSYEKRNLWGNKCL